MANKLLLEDLYPTHYMPNVGRQVMQQGGEPITGEVSYLEDEQTPLPTFAQPQAQQVTQALNVARELPKKEYEPFGVLPFKETEEGVSFDPYAGLLGTITRPAKYFYETMTGQKEMDPTGEEAIRAATDIAGNITMGAGAFERPAGALAAGASRPVAETPRVTNPIGMHSEAAEVVRNLPQQKGTIEQMLAMIRQKVNPEEIHWSGVQQAFQPGQKVTAEELASHFESKLPQVQETVYGGGRFEPKYGNFDWTPQQWQNAIRRAEMNRDFDLSEALTAEWEASEGMGRGVKAPKYPEYKTPGGTNYREIVLHHSPSWTPNVEEKYGRFGFTGPDGKYREYWTKQEAEQASRSLARTSGDFTESHYDEPNIVGHLRMSDMVGPSGEKILNVHEFQSDWGQAARKKGVASGKEAEEREALVAKQQEMQQRITDEVRRIKQAAGERYRNANFSEPEIERLLDRMSPADLARVAGGDELQNDYMRLIEENARLYGDIKATESRTPAAPYVTSREGQHHTPGWTDLLIKRVMQEAERGGYDKVVWDTPAEQARRYMNLPKIVKGMEGYYGDVLPRRFKKVVPEAKLGEHQVGQVRNAYDKDSVAEFVTGAATTEEHKKFTDLIKEGMNREQALRAIGMHDEYLLNEADKHGLGDFLEGLNISKLGDKHYVLYDGDTTKGMFDSEREAQSALHMLGAEKAKEALESSGTMRPGFEMTPELVERVRKGFSAYRYGGEVEDALSVARLL